MSIEHDITDHIDTKLAAMSVSGGYSYDYSNVNEYKTDDKTYPNIKTTYLETEAEPDERMANKYTSMIDTLITITVDDTEDVDLMLTKVLSDVQKMFNDEYENLREKGMISVWHDGYTKTYNLNKKRPGMIQTRWDLKYRVSMDDPTST